jgi:hypothetical protein
MDFGDEGQEITENLRADAIAKVRSEARTNKFPITGTCYNPLCGDDSPDRPFCSKECRDEYDRVEVLNRRNGHGH